MNNSLRKLSAKRRDSCPENPPPAKRVAGEPDDPAYSLCARCIKLPWADLRQRRPESSKGELVARVPDSHLQLLQSSCEVCQLLALVKPPSLDTARCFLRLYSGAKVLSAASGRRRKGFKDCSVMGVAPTGKSYTACQATGFVAVLEANINDANYDIGPREVLPHKLNYDLIRQWISYCEFNHGKPCESRQKTLPDGFRVIDCNSRQVIQAPSECDYVALSYVWGGAASNNHNRALLDDERLNQVPAVIEDSIVATKCLGYRYLWVDRYVSTLKVA